MTTDQKGRVSDETFDECLAGQGILEASEDHAIEEAVQTQGLIKP